MNIIIIIFIIFIINLLSIVESFVSIGRVSPRPASSHVNVINKHNSMTHKATKNDNICNDSSKIPKGKDIFFFYVILIFIIYLYNKNFPPKYH